MNECEEQELQQRFSELGRELLNAFPETDLRLNRLAGTEILRIAAPEYGDQSAEISLGGSEPEKLIWEAIFSVKELLGRYDS